MTLIAATFCLVNCGGGSSENTVSAQPNPTPSTIQPTQNSNNGSVTARIVAGTNVGSIVISGGSQLFSSNPLPIIQDTSGALSSFGDNNLTGATSATQDIAGDSNFAMGRWNHGVATNTRSTPPLVNNLDISSNASLHYIVYNRPAGVPLTGTMTCDGGKFTAPTLASTGNNTITLPNYGSATGTATLSFSQAGANIAINIITTAGISSGTKTITGTISPANSFNGGIISGGGFSNGVFIADGINGGIRLVGLHNTTLANGSSYLGVFEFSCT